MGVRRLFRGRAKFSRGGGRGGPGAKTYYLPKNILFSSKKKSKNMQFWPARGVKGPLLPSPADAHSLPAVARSDTIQTNSQNSWIIRQASVSNISQNKWQSCIH